MIGYNDQNSPFETMLRALPLTPISDFCTKEGDLSPAVFDVALTDTQQFSHAAFPILSQKNGAFLGVGRTMTYTERPLNVAVFFSGGPAAGGHNVIVGLKEILRGHRVYGVKAGPKGLLAGALFEIHTVDEIRNTGGFDFLGSDRTKITTEAQFAQVREVVKTYALDGIVVVGGDDSNTNAAFLAEALADLKCSVVGVPKTIDGDLQVGSFVPISFGFDTATRIYAELVGNILKDTPSSRKYWHFVKLMGRSASHIALEVALQTQPMITLISEEIAQKKQTLDAIVTDMAKIVALRAAQGKAYGVILIPEGVIEFIPDLTYLIGELNEAMGKLTDQAALISQRKAYVLERLSDASKQVFVSLPSVIQEKLLMDRDSHGNLQVSQIPSEELFISAIAAKISEIQKAPEHFFSCTPDESARIRTFSFAALNHFFGYEGRCGAPSRFDAEYTYNLGLAAGTAILQGLSGYMVGIKDLDKGGRAVAIPLLSLIHEERRHGKTSFVIKKALVELDSPAFQYFAQEREGWALSDSFSSPGPRQYSGPCAQLMPLSVALNQGYKAPFYKIG